MSKNRKAAEHAAQWWGDRIMIDDPALGELNPRRGKVTPEQREKFRAALAEKVERELDDRGRCRLECDYDPWDILLEAVQEAGIECRGCMFSPRGILPQKHSLDVTPEKLSPKEGYGNRTEDIPLTPDP